MVYLDQTIHKIIHSNDNIDIEEKEVETHS